MLVLETLGAPQRRLLAGRRPKALPSAPPPEPVTTARATLVAARPFDDDGSAKAWAGSVDLDAYADEAVTVLNQVLQAHRTAAADPFTREVTIGQALAVRVGIGEGEQVAHGRWRDARQLPRPRTRLTVRAGALRPQERLAALLGGRDVALAAEELTLRARLDVDRGRYREAAFQLRVALEAALAELQVWSHRGDMAERLAELRDARDAVAGAANRALEGGLESKQIEDLERVLRRLEGALAARVAGGLE